MCHGLLPSPCISCTRSGLFWTSLSLYFNMMFVCSDHFLQMVTFHCWGNFILKTRFYSTLQYREMMHFLPCPTFVENWSNRSSGVQIQRYLYSFWVLFVLCWVKLNNNTCYSFQQHEKWNLPFSSVLLLISTDSTFPNDLKRSLCTCHSEKRRFNFNSAC